MSKRMVEDSKIYLCNGNILFVGNIVDTDFHKHHVIQIALALDHEFYFQNEKEVQSVKFVITNSDYKHKITGNGGTQLLLLIDPESIYGENIRKYLQGNNYLFFTIKNDLVKEIRNNINSKSISISTIIKIIFSFLKIEINQQVSIDDRIEKVIQIIENTYEKKVTINELAQKVFLSESRLQHIFKDQVGISIKRYLLWRRLIDGINIIINNKNFTYASHEAGFADSAHMSRTFKEMFGINLQDIFKNSRSVQVKICNY